MEEDHRARKPFYSSLAQTFTDLIEIEKRIPAVTTKHDAFLQELGMARCHKKSIPKRIERFYQIEALRQAILKKLPSHASRTQQACPKMKPE